MRFLIIRKVMKLEMSQMGAADFLNTSDRQVRSPISTGREKGSQEEMNLRLFKWIGSIASPPGLPGEASLRNFFEKVIAF